MAWAAVSASTAAVHNYKGLVVSRFFLGFVEAPVRNPSPLGRLAAPDDHFSSTLVLSTSSPSSTPGKKLQLASLSCTQARSSAQAAPA
jgi:hypothetical protein